MVEINLLPWRAIIHAENAKRKKLFFICFATLMLLWIVSHIGFSLIAKMEGTTISNLQNQLTELANQTSQDQINPSLLIVDQIHSSQLELVEFFKTLAQEMQGMITWSAIASQKNNVIMTGHIDSFSMLAKFVNAYNTKNQKLPMAILSVKNNDDVSAIQFRLRIVRSLLPFLSQIKNDDDI